jgi:hypothetical protein
VRVRSIVVHIPLVRDLAVFVWRVRMVVQPLWSSIRQSAVWLFRSKETTNFTYELTALNRRYLASLIAEITGRQYHEIARYMDELETNVELRAHIRARTVASADRWISDADAHYGRRAGWYAVVRAMKPRVVVETGVDKGLGSIVLTSALMRNAREGYPGRYYGTDINPQAGWMLAGKYANWGEILYGDSVTVLKQLEMTIDLFVQDSDHSYRYEENEYRLVSARLSANAIVLGDNSHCSDALLEFALTTGRQFVFFRETPDGHWYNGAGIGIAFRRPTGEAS